MSETLTRTTTVNKHKIGIKERTEKKLAAVVVQLPLQTMTTLRQVRKNIYIDKGFERKLEL